MRKLLWRTLMVAMVFVLSCNQPPPAKDSVSLTPVNDSLAIPDTTTEMASLTDEDPIFSSDSAVVAGQFFKAVYKKDGVFAILNSKDSILFSSRGMGYDFRFTDFDQDGYEDLLVDQIASIPGAQDLLLFDKQTNGFRQIDFFYLFPASEKIRKTPYYFSYHRSGCADMNWDSDLFYLKDFQVYKIANIAGRECGDTGVKDGIYINKVRADSLILVKKMPINTINRYKDYKWGFIKKYWSDNFKNFNP